MLFISFSIFPTLSPSSLHFLKLKPCLVHSFSLPCSPLGARTILQTQKPQQQWKAKETAALASPFSWWCSPYSSLGSSFTTRTLSQWLSSRSWGPSLSKNRNRNEKKRFPRIQELNLRKTRSRIPRKIENRLIWKLLWQKRRWWKSMTKKKKMSYCLQKTVTCLLGNGFLTTWHTLCTKKTNANSSLHKSLAWGMEDAILSIRIGDGSPEIALCPSTLWFLNFLFSYFSFLISLFFSGNFAINWLNLYKFVKVQTETFAWKAQREEAYVCWRLVE